MGVKGTLDLLPTESQNNLKPIAYRWTLNFLTAVGCKNYKTFDCSGLDQWTINLKTTEGQRDLKPIAYRGSEGP